MEVLGEASKVLKNMVGLLLILNTLNITLYLTMPHASGKNLGAITDMALSAIVHLFDDHFLLLLHISSGHLLQ